jgi:DNA-binding CsgD family transcriptional regulator
MNKKMLMFNKVTSSRYHDKMIQSIEPLKTHLKVNHFWYNKVTSSGYYSYFGTHTDWSAYCSENPELVRDIPYLSDPNTAKEGIQLFGYTTNQKLQKLMDLGRIKYKTNFNLMISKKTSEGFEGYGFGCSDNSPATYERLLNEIPLLTRFIEDFKEDNAPIYKIIDEYHVNIDDILGPEFRKLKINNSDVYDRIQLLEKFRINIPPLTQRELVMLQYCANGYPVSYIAEQLTIGKRTVESHIINLKDKLDCYSKIELIQKAKEITSLLSNNIILT